MPHSKSRLPAAVAAIVFLTAFLAAAFLRLTDLESRPMHTDEAIQAAIMDNTIADGAFDYDPTDYHGPGLIFSTIGLRSVTGQPLATDLTATALRIVPALFALLLIASLALFYDGLGRPATVIAALLLAVSPIFVYYSRYYIMEVPLVAFTSLFIGCGYRYYRTGKIFWAVAAGLAAGLMHVTKETAAISWLATGIGLVILVVPRFRSGSTTFKFDPRHLLHYFCAVAAGLFISALLFSTFFQNTGAIADSFRTYFLYADRAGGAGHEKPWHEYLTLLTFRKDVLVWSEAPTVALGLIGIISAFRNRISNLPRFLALYTVATFTIYSIIPYKTPWSILPAYFGLVLLAGYGAVAAFRFIPNPKLAVPLAALLACATLWWYQTQNTRANGRFAADNRNPYVYAHTTGDLVKLADRILTLTKFHPAGSDMPVKICAAPDAGWPLPWYLRDLPNVEYLSKLPESAADAPVCVVGVAQFKTSTLSAFFPETYHASLFGFRPGSENQVILYVEPTLWRRFIDSRR